MAQFVESIPETLQKEHPSGCLPVSFLLFVAFVRCCSKAIMACFVSVGLQTSQIFGSLCIQRDLDCTRIERGKGRTNEKNTINVRTLIGWEKECTHLVIQFKKHKFHLSMILDNHSSMRVVASCETNPRSVYLSCGGANLFPNCYFHSPHGNTDDLAWTPVEVELRSIQQTKYIWNAIR